MGQRVTMFALPFVVVGISQLAAAVSGRLLPLRGAMLAGLAAYYVAIAASVILVRRTIPGAQGAPSLYSGKRPSARRVALGVLLPALPLCGFFLLNLRPVSPTVVGAIVAFAAVNACLEETFWRGVMAHLPAPNRIRILYPAAVFAFAHWFMPLSPRNVVIMLISTFVLGIVWMWFYLRERSLLFPIASHFAIDVFALLAAVMRNPSRLF